MTILWTHFVELPGVHLGRIVTQLHLLGLSSWPAARDLTSVGDHPTKTWGDKSEEQGR